MVAAEGTIPELSPGRLRLGFRVAGLAILAGLAIFVLILAREHLRAPRLAALSKSISVLEHSIGYGGLIHCFKNYVLRPDEPTYAIQAREAARNTLAVLDVLAQEPLLESSGNDILQSRLAVDGYLSRLDTVERLHIAGATAREIDAVVRYDDGPTLASLSRLRQAVEDATTAHLATSARSSVAMLILALAGSVCALQAMRAENNRSLRAFEKAQAAYLREQTVNLELQEFSYSISHDLRGPLNTIQMMIEEIRDGADRDRLNDDQRELLSHGLETVQRVQAQIEDLMSYAGMVAEAESTDEPIDLASKFASICEDLRADISASGAVVTIGPLPEILGNRAHLRSLGQNLISNALKYRRPDVPPHVEISSEIDGVTGWAKIHVADNGLGIAPEHVDRIFEIFKRLHRQDQIPGSGLGLTICRRVAVKLGGELTVRSQPGVGSTFTLHVPPGRLVS